MQSLNITMRIHFGTNNTLPCTDDEAMAVVEARANRGQSTHVDFGRWMDSGKGIVFNVQESGTFNPDGSWVTGKEMAEQAQLQLFTKIWKANGRRAMQSFEESTLLAWVRHHDPIYQACSQRTEQPDREYRTIRDLVMHEITKRQSFTPTTQPETPTVPTFVPTVSNVIEQVVSMAL